MCLRVNLSIGHEWEHNCPKCRTYRRSIGWVNRRERGANRNKSCVRICSTHGYMAYMRIGKQNQAEEKWETRSKRVCPNDRTDERDEGQRATLSEREREIKRMCARNTDKEKVIQYKRMREKCSFIHKLCVQCSFKWNITHEVMKSFSRKYGIWCLEST